MILPVQSLKDMRASGRPLSRMAVRILYPGQNHVFITLPESLTLLSLVVGEHSNCQAPMSSLTSYSNTGDVGKRHYWKWMNVALSQRVASDDEEVAMKFQKVVLETVPHSAKPTHPKILVIEDSPTVQKILKVGLGRKGMIVVGCTDGVAAIHWLMTPEAWVPDLVILDIGLPKMDGFEVARRLKARLSFARTPIIMLTRRTGLLDRLKGKLAGANLYITKPFRMEEIVAHITVLLERADRPDGTSTAF